MAKSYPYDDSSSEDDEDELPIIHGTTAIAMRDARPMQATHWPSTPAFAYNSPHIGPGSPPIFIKNQYNYGSGPPHPAPTTKSDERVASLEAHIKQLHTEHGIEVESMVKEAASRADEYKNLWNLRISESVDAAKKEGSLKSQLDQKKNEVDNLKAEVERLKRKGGRRRRC